MAWQLTVNENFGPTVVTGYTTPTHIVSSGSQFSFTHTANLFFDCDDGIDSVSMIQSNGDPLPFWINYDPATYTYFGVAGEVASDTTFYFSIYAWDT